MTQVARAGDRHRWAPGTLASWSCPPVPLCPHLGRSCSVSWEAGATSCYRAVHPVCGSTAVTDCQTTAKHWKKDVWQLDSSTGRVRLPDHRWVHIMRYTNMVWCPAMWTVLLKRIGIFMCFALNLHLITLLIRATFSSRSDASSLRITWLFSMHHFRISRTKWNELL